MRIWKRREKCVWKGLASGAVGGLAAAYVMNQFQALMKKITGGEQPQGSRSAERRGRQQGRQGQEGAEREPPTVKAAEAISESVFDHPLTKREEKAAGPAAHYVMGATSGAVYGVTAEFRPKVTAGAGLPFGAAVWLVADEVAVPAFGLSKPPWKTPLSTHARALVSHFVYGLTTDAVRRVVRRAL